MGNFIDKILKEAIELPIEIGDVILTGKFRNKKTIVKDIGEDEHGLPTVNGKNIMKIRIQKLEEDYYDYYKNWAEELKANGCDREAEKIYGKAELAKLGKLKDGELLESVNRIIEAFLYKQVISTNLKRIGYDNAKKILQLEFQSGGVYNYKNVPTTIWNQLNKASSKGSFAANNICHEFQYQRIK